MVQLVGKYTSSENYEFKICIIPFCRTFNALRFTVGVKYIPSVFRPCF